MVTLTHGNQCLASSNYTEPFPCLYLQVQPQQPPTPLPRVSTTPTQQFPSRSVSPTEYARVPPLAPRSPTAPTRSLPFSPPQPQPQPPAIPATTHDPLNTVNRGPPPSAPSSTAIPTSRLAFSNPKLGELDLPTPPDRKMVEMAERSLLRAIILRPGLLEPFSVMVEGKQIQLSNQAHQVSA